MLTMSKEHRERQKFERDYRANARVLRGLRARAKMNLKALAKKADVNYTTISRIENGHNRSPHWSTLEQLAGALNVDVEKLVIFEDSQDFDDVPEEPGLTEENRAKLDAKRREWDKLDGEKRGEGQPNGAGSRDGM